jgi:hypothetical protein
MGRTVFRDQPTMCLIAQCLRELKPSPFETVRATQH